MTSKDRKTKEQYIKDIDKVYDKYSGKNMKCTFDSWSFDATP